MTDDGKVLEKSTQGGSDKAQLVVEGVGLSFGGVRALDNVSTEVRRGEIFAIIGPNGAGKTCLLNCVSGFYRAQQGEVYFEGQKITNLSPHKIAVRGLGRTFQNIQLYTGLSTVENLMAGRHFLMKQSWLSGALYFGWAHSTEIKHRRAVEDVIDFLEIEFIRDEKVGALPYGLRKRVELGRALVQDPKILLLDEPMAGMNLEEKEDMARFIIDIQEERGIAIVLIEHDMGVVMDISDRVMVLDFGRKIAEGSPTEVKASPEVIKAYLGAPA